MKQLTENQILTDKEADGIATNCSLAYSKNGLGGVCEFANAIGLPYGYCQQCETETPTIRTIKRCDCAACGTGKKTTRKVTIPAQQEHQGYYAIEIDIADTCPVCGEKRGEPSPTISWDGSRRLRVHGWVNDCGHPDFYSDIREQWTKDHPGEQPIRCFGGLRS